MKYKEMDSKEETIMTGSSGKPIDGNGELLQMDKDKNFPKPLLDLEASVKSEQVEVTNELISDSDDDYEAETGELESIVKVELSYLSSDSQGDDNIPDPDPGSGKLSHSKDAPFKCSECSYEGKTISLVRRHFKYKHSTERPFMCSECNFGAVDFTALRMHKLHTHTTTKPFKCSECSFATKSMSNLLKHSRCKHSTERPFKCSECSYASVDLRHLRSHKLAKHNTEKPYKCDECSFEAVQFQTLHSHKKYSHSSERPHKCSECTFAAKTAQYLRRHFKVNHIQGKSFKCNECSFATASSRNLESHKMYKHSTERPFKCPECSYSAKHTNALRNHMERHKDSTERPRNCQCPYCPYAAFRGGDLRKHVADVHSSQLTSAFGKCKKRKPQKLPRVKPIHEEGEFLSDSKHEEFEDEDDGIAATNDDQPGLLYCSKCSFVTQSISDLMNHSTTHQLETEEAIGQC